jgi:hypothetical protein
MTKLKIKLLAVFEIYPISAVAFVLTMLLWAYISFSQILIFLHPVPKGVADYRGEGIMYGVILTLFLSAIFLVVTILNLTLQRNKSFYMKLSALIVISNLILYGIGLLL